MTTPYRSENDAAGIPPRSFEEDEYLNLLEDNLREATNLLKTAVAAIKFQRTYNIVIGAVVFGMTICLIAIAALMR